MAKATVAAEPESIGIGEKAARMVSIADIRAVQNLPQREFFVKEWGGNIVIQAFTRKVAEQIREDCKVEDEHGNRVPNQQIAERLTFQRGIIQPHFTSAEVEEIFNSAPAMLIESIIIEIGRLNKTDENALEEARHSFRA